MDSRRNRIAVKFQRSMLLVLYLFFFYGTYLFMSGLMPFQVTKSQPEEIHVLASEPFDEGFFFSNATVNEISIYKPRYQRIVLIIIDALRADFVLPKPYIAEFFSDPPFAFVNRLIKNGEALAFVSKAYSPTVTLPRIKTLISGTLPSFLDVLINFSAQKLMDDNLISIAHMRNRKIVFYGDDTWIQLLPGKFLRFQGTHSFYVSDYTEVDSNVTEHLNIELKKRDWDMMILHYLGVDHIGHAHGPFSTMLPKKLQEMDNVLEHIYKSLKSSGSSVGTPDLIVLCSDHGMTGSGNHGGNSEAELLTPLVFISTRTWQNIVANLSKTVSQLDVAVTLAVLLGLPIPHNNMGVVIPEILLSSGMMPREVLYAVYYNMQQLYSVHKRILNTELPISPSLIQETIARHRSWLKYATHKNSSVENSDYFYLLNRYVQNMQQIKNSLVINSSGFKNERMQIGITIIWTAIFLIVVICEKQERASFLPKITISTMLCFMLSFCVLYILISDLITIICTIIIFTSMLYILKKIAIFTIVTMSKEKVYICLTFLHIVSFGSSSFIEEEHQTWYFLLNSILLIFLWNHLIQFLCHVIHNHSVKLPNVSLCMDIRHKNEFPGNGSHWNWSLCLFPVALLILHRLFRSWNQTGNKWLQLSDISDWLSKSEHLYAFQLSVIFSFIVVLAAVWTKLDGVARYITISGIIWTYIYKCVNTSVLSYHTNLGPHIVFTFAGILIFITVLKYAQLSRQRYSKPYHHGIKDLIACVVASWLLLVITVGRVKNIPIIAGVLVQEYVLNELTWKRNKNAFINTWCYLVLSMCSFFYMGNSNSLSTIDVFTGYTGLSTYHPFSVGLLLACNTYNCVVTVLLMIFYRICSCYHPLVLSHKAEHVIEVQLANCCCGLILYRLFLLSICIVITYFQRYHLFILSVFIPKLFYEIFHTVVFMIVLTFMFCIC